VQATVVVRALMLIAATALFSCATAVPGSRSEVDFFVPAAADDPWNRKIQNWQARHSLDPAVRGETETDASRLGRDWDRFSRKIRRDIAAETVEWVQARSRSHYRADGARDHWATLGEVIETGADDCDGLDLLTFVLLRRMGFGEFELYRAILVEDGTAQHHMVTLWFEDGQRSDPYVLDPTGVVTSKMDRLSDVPNWQPIELFDEDAHFAVEQRPTLAVGLR
jgi:hypothetical protein